ncbi:CotH kinase family protein [Spirosoma gilvum]
MQRRAIYCIIILNLLHLLVNGQSFTSSNLPIVIITTGGKTIVDDPKIVADLAIIDNGTGKRNTLTDTPTFTSKIGIELRGSTSQNFPKKPYGFELRDASGQSSVNAPILGMPSESDWVLNAMYNDKSLIREPLTYDLNRQLSTYYTPRYRFCEVVLDGNYNGVYMLMEKIKRNKNRVNISSIKTTDNTGDAVTGGYIFKIDKYTGSDSRDWNSPYKTNNIAIPIQIDKPKIDEITEPQYQYAKQFVTDFENTLAGAKYQDSAVGYRKYIHDDSFVDYMIMTEVAHNLDGFRLSVFFYKDRDSKDGRMVMGPIWDYNLAYGNANYCNGNSYQGWSYAYDKVCENDPYQAPFWWYRLVSDPRFSTAVRTKYQNLRKELLKTERVQAYIDSVANGLAESQGRNFQRWPILGVYVWPNSFVGKTYQEEINFLKTWVKNRLEWMDNAILTLGMQPLAVEPIPEFSVTIQPNPSAGDVTVRYRLQQRANVLLTITDANGRMIRQFIRPDQSIGEHQETLPTQLLPSAPGEYILQLTTDGHMVSQKMLRF